jgi:quinolinate synthase
MGMATGAKITTEQLQQRVLELKEQSHALILAHNYQRPEIQDIADFTGDSLELSRKSVGAKADIIVFCGVRFMAETAAILNPDSTVLLSQVDAGCPLAETIDVETLRQWKKRYPNATVVAYVNTTADIKAESDVCCTSANALDVVNAIPGQEVLFIPDQNLGHYVSTRTDKRVILYPGFCYVHNRITARDVNLARQRYPQAKVLVHPECRPEVISLADAALSTSQMLRYAQRSDDRLFIIGTEEGILHALRQQNPAKEFHIIAHDFICTDMKKTTLEVLIETMELRENVVDVPVEVARRARRAIDKMLDIT